MKEKSDKKTFSRRKLFQRGAIVLGGTVVATYLGRSPLRRFAAQAVENLDFPATISTFKPDFWFEVLSDNKILLKSPKIEMGQGIFTGFAMIAAEELDVSPEQIIVEHANNQTGSIDSASTGGSTSTNSLFTPLREVAATMREMLKEAAAKKWQVKASEITANNGILTSANHKSTYYEISSSTHEWTIPKTPTLKPISAFKYVGKSMKRIDLKPKVLGKPLYGIDQVFPEMLYAVTLQTPFIGGTIKSINIKEAAQMPDVLKIIQEKDLAAVVAKNRYAAQMALEKIEATWDIPKKWQQTDFDSIITVGNGTEVNVQKAGNPSSVLKEAGKNVFKQEYRTPMAVHAHMEPNGTVANVEKDKATIFIGTQAPSMVLDQVSKALGMASDKIKLEPTFVGGGFGRRMNINNAANAARISQIMGKPIHLFNTREQEFLNAHYRPNTHHVLEAKIGKNNEIEAITHNQATADQILEALAGNTALSILGADFISAGHGASILYNIPNKSATIWQNKLPLATGIWRGVGMMPNTFAIESFMNELAFITGKDPIAFRLELLAGNDKINQRYKNVLTTLAEKSNWKAPKISGIGRGMAITNDRKTIAAAVVEIQIIENKIIIKKVVQVLDAGMIINPEGIKMQIEGATMMGITASLYENLTIKDGQITASNFNDYPMVTLMDTPEIESIILQGDNEIPYGVGEPPLAPIAPAIAAAIFDITGKRLRTLPFKLV